MLGLERNLVYFPDKTLLRKPDSLGLRYRDIWLRTRDRVQIHGWMIDDRSDRTVLLFHGNAGNISFRLGEVALLVQRLNVNVFLLDYRGFGLSDGRPSERGTRLDAAAAVEFLLEEVGTPVGRLIYFGRSLGAAVATDLAARVRPAALILESPLPSVMRMTQASYPWIAPMLNPLFLTRYDTLTSLGRVKAPVFIAHGDEDEVIPFALGREVFEAAREPKVWYPVAGAGHNDMVVTGGSAYLDALTTFVRTHVPEPAVSDKAVPGANVPEAGVPSATAASATVPARLP
ncbi:MAG: alpha/beta hydrolase [Chloroflexi bacterium]|nr:alpha/beta hydrolase [Chloroflexota bacterium]